MISGSPFETGFLHMAVPDSCPLVIKSFGGCTIERASKHFAKAFAKGPFEIVVVQFGAIDSNVDLMLLSKLRDGSSQIGVPSTSPQSPSRYASTMRWVALDLLALISKRWVTSLDAFLGPMRKILEHCERNGSKAIVVSPFISGPKFKSRRAALYRTALANLLLEYPNAIFVDAFSFLERFKKRKVLMHNGFHLSSYGHEVLSAVVRKEIEVLL